MSGKLLFFFFSFFFFWLVLSFSISNSSLLFTSVVRFSHCLPRAKPVLLSCGSGSNHRRCFQPPFYQQRCFHPLQTLNLALIPCLYEALFIPLSYKTHKHLPLDSQSSHSMHSNLPESLSCFHDSSYIILVFFFKNFICYS